MRFLYLLGAIVVLGSSQLSVQAQKNLPLDLYLVVDQSGSLTRSQFRDMVDFGEDLTLALANVTGWYFSPIENGLRVSLITFVCGGTKARIKPSGNVDFVTRKFDSIRRTVIPNGDTCLRNAVNLINDFVKEAENLISPPVRTSAMVVLTDGRFDDFNDFQNSLSNFKQGEESQVFSVGVGDNTNQNQLDKVAGDSNRVFNLDGTDSLNKVVGTITSFLLSGFHIH